MTSQERLVQAGLELFHRHGIHPVGLDRILMHAGVTKTTFYKYFESKDAFVCAVLDEFATKLLKQINFSFEKPNNEEVRAQLLAMFQAWDNLQYDKTYRGCLLIAAGVASGDPRDPARASATRYRRQVLTRIESFARHAGFRSPGRFAARYGAILDSSLLARQFYGDESEAQETLLMAEELIASAINERDASR
jgi:AcrR family transcriptional regulator